MGQDPLLELCRHRSAGSEPTIQTMEMVKTGRRVPLWQADTYIKNGEPVTPALWTEDLIAPPPLHGQQPGGGGS